MAGHAAEAQPLFEKTVLSPWADCSGCELGRFETRPRDRSSPHHSVAVRVEVQALNVAQRYLVIDRSSHEVADVSGKFGPLSVDDVPEPHQLEDVADTADGIGEVLGNTGKFEFADGGEELAAAVAWLWNWENSRSRASKSGYQRGFRSS